MLTRRAGRIGIAAQMLGLAQGAFDKAVPYTFQRSQFGKPVATFQGMAFQQAEAAIELEAARLLTYNAARRKEEGLDFVREAAIAKYYASQVAQKVSGAAIEWAGGVGFTRETGIEKYWRDSKIVSLRGSSARARHADIFGSTGCDLRGDVKHPAPDYCQVHPKAVLIACGDVHQFCGRMYNNLLFNHITGLDPLLSNASGMGSPAEVEQSLCAHRNGCSRWFSVWAMSARN